MRYPAMPNVLGNRRPTAGAKPRRWDVRVDRRVRARIREPPTNCSCEPCDGHEAERYARMVRLAKWYGSQCPGYAAGGKRQPKAIKPNATKEEKQGPPDHNECNKHDRHRVEDVCQITKRAAANLSLPDGAKGKSQDKRTHEGAEQCSDQEPRGRRRVRHGSALTNQGNRRPAAGAKRCRRGVRVDRQVSHHLRCRQRNGLRRPCMQPTTTTRFG